MSENSLDDDAFGFTRTPRFHPGERYGYILDRSGKEMTQSDSTRSPNSGDDFRLGQPLKTSSALGAGHAVIASLSFSYAHISHMIAFAKALAEIGYRITFVIHQKYSSNGLFTELGQVVSANTFLKSSSTEPFSLGIICNSAIKNETLARTLRSNGARVLYAFHEPVPLLSLNLIRSEGWKKAIRASLSAYSSMRTVRVCSGVIVHSECARSLYDKRYRRYNENAHTMPLLFDDEIGDEQFAEAGQFKRYFGFIGSACKAHGFGTYVSFLKYAIRTGSSIQFAIVTNVDLTSILVSDKELSNLSLGGRILIQHGRLLSNDEINRRYLDCFGIWNVYRRSTQSGVLPRAFMAGTPVLASPVGSFPEFIRGGVTGELLSPNADFSQILAMVEKLRDGISAYSHACRTEFINTFYYGANLDRLSEIVRRSS